MPEIYINGRSSSHNSSLETEDFETRYATSHGLSVTAESYNSTISIRSPANILDSDASFCGIVPLIVLCCFALVFVITIAIFLARRRQRPKTRRKH